MRLIERVKFKKGMRSIIYYFFFYKKMRRKKNENKIKKKNYQRNFQRKNCQKLLIKTFTNKIQELLRLNFQRQSVVQ